MLISDKELATYDSEQGCFGEYWSTYEVFCSRTFEEFCFFFSLDRTLCYVNQLHNSIVEAGNKGTLKTLDFTIIRIGWYNLVTHNPPSKKIITIISFRETFTCSLQTWVGFPGSVFHTITLISDKADHLQRGLAGRVGRNLSKYPSNIPVSG